MEGEGSLVDNTELSVSEHTVWFTSFQVVDSDGHTDAHLRVDYDGDLEMILRDVTYRGRVSSMQLIEGIPTFTTMWDSMDSSILQQSVHKALQEVPGQVLARLRL